MSRQLTFLFTDIEGSTRIWEEQTTAMQSALELHDSAMKDTIEASGGKIVKTTGDGFHAVFEDVHDGVSAALAGQLVLVKTTWPQETGRIRVRMGLHIGDSQSRAGDYYGPTVNRCARIMSIGHGDQILLSNSVAALVQADLPENTELKSLGEHLLRDLTYPETIHQLTHPDLPENSDPLSSLSTYKHNFPTQLSEFIGRENELKAIEEHLDDSHLVSLIGPGGTGKSRLALQAAANLLDDFSDGAWLVELASLTDPSLINERIASVFNIQGQPDQRIQDGITTYLRRKNLLLILDNVEHMVRECAEIANQILQHCPDIKILVTGREALFIQGETTLQIQSLALPDLDESDLAEIEKCEAVQFFLKLARDIHPDFRLDQANVESIIQIIQQLDGIPLVLELAVARLRVLSVEQIAARLDDRFRLLTGGRRGVLPRQQTLHALVDWSWNLLDQTEQVILRRLSVFTGGWTLAGAQIVVGDEQINEFDIIDGMEQLLNKSMITVQRLANGAMRYRMLESIRYYSLERLEEAGESEVIRERHAEYYTNLGVEFSSKLESVDMLKWVDPVLNEYENAQAAREWALAHRLDLAMKMTDLTMQLTRYWIVSAEGVRWLKQVIEKGRQVLELDPDAETEVGLAYTLICLGSAQVFRGQYADARVSLEDGIALSKKHDLIHAQVYGMGLLIIALRLLNELASVNPLAEENLALCDIHDLKFLKLMTMVSYVPALAMQGEFEKARTFISASFELSEVIKNPPLQALAYHNRGRLEVVNQYIEIGLEWFSKAAELYGQIRDYALMNIASSEVAHIMRKTGDLAGALETYKKTMVRFQESGILSAVAHQLECVAMIAVVEGLLTQAINLVYAAKKIREQTQSPHQPNEQSEIDELLLTLEKSVSENVLQKESTIGSQMEVDDAISLAQSIEVDD